MLSSRSEAKSAVDLIAKLISAKVGSRELDCEVWYFTCGAELVIYEQGEVRAQWYDENVVSDWETVGYEDPGQHQRNFTCTRDEVPSLTTSTDAIFALIGEKLGSENLRWQIKQITADHYLAEIYKISNPQAIISSRYALSPALALCSALLRALEETP